MMGKTKIEWATDSWNPIRARNKATGKIGWHCQHVTTGCEFCYAEGINKRLGTGLPFKPGHSKDIELFLDEKMLLAPLRWRKPRMVFVCSMTDLFADFIPDRWIDRVFAVMALCPQHIFQVLTKRATRMRGYFETRRDGDPWAEAADAVADMVGMKEHPVVLEPRDLPLPNVWLGISAERQQEADERIPDLLAAPAAVRFVSAEPLLGPIDFLKTHDRGGHWDWLTGSFEDCREKSARAKLDWVICGGESGPGARPMNMAWASSIVAQCKAADVACFVKQMGPQATGPHSNGVNETTWQFKDRKGGDMAEWPEDLRVREFPRAYPASQRFARANRRIRG
jgi:protein gp37